MAEIGLIASILGVASAGAKLSLTLYQFADIVGNAATEVRDIASEISLFCSVLRQLDSTLQRAKATRYSLTALATAEAIMAECRRVFSQIQALVDGLKRESLNTPEELSLAWTARVKWVFQRSKMALYRSRLESMKTTLLLMLTTLAIAERSSRMALEDLDDENDQALAQSLVITQQIALDKLRVKEENEVENDGLVEGDAEKKAWEAAPAIKIESFEFSWQPDTSTDNSSAGSKARKRQNRTSQVMNGMITDKGLYSPNQESYSPNEQFKLSWDEGDIPGSRGRERVDSTWLSNTVFTDGLTPAGRRESWTRNSAATLANYQVKSLLSRWIDHADPRKFQSRKSPPQLKPDTSYKSGHARSPSGSNLTSPKKPDLSPQRSPKTPDTPGITSESPTPAAHVFKNSTLGLDWNDRTPQVLLRYLHMFNHSADPKGYSLYIEVDNEESGGRQERLSLPQETPLRVFRSLSEEGKMPQFLLKKKDVGNSEFKLWTKRIVSLDGLASD